MIPVAFDVRDPFRSGIARVATSMAAAFVANDHAGRYRTHLCGPVDLLHSAGLGGEGLPQATLVAWDAGRLSLSGEISWPAVSRAVGRVTWYFPHWDVPWLASPSRSIVTINDVIPIVVPGATSMARRAVAKRWIRRSGMRATRIVVSTQYTRSEVIGLWPDFEEKLRVVPLGVDSRFLGEPGPLPDDLLGLLDSSPYMLSVGNKKPHKNLIVGPEVLARLPNLTWVVVGERFGGWEEVMAAAARLRVADRIRVLEPRSDAVVHSLYSNAACLFFPSRNEGFGLPILEALASGTRVVAGRAGASVEVLGDQGTVCDLDDHDAFAGAVDAAVRAGPPDAAGRCHAASFTWSRAAKQIADLVDEIGGL